MPGRDHLTGYARQVDKKTGLALAIIAVFYDNINMRECVAQDAPVKCRKDELWPS